MSILSDCIDEISQLQSELLEMEDKNVALEKQVDALVAQVAQLRKTLERAGYILDFHAGRCPLNPLRNYSGSEEHLAMYRDVMREIKKDLAELDKEGEKV